MIYDYQLRVTPEIAANEQRIKAYIAQEKDIRADAIRIIKRSIDARQRTIYVNLTVKAYVSEQPAEETIIKIF